MLWKGYADCDVYRGCFSHKKPKSFAEFRKLTLLALKYGLKNIVEEATAYLNTHFPASFQALLEKEKLEGNR